MAQTPSRLLLVSDGMRKQIDDKGRLQNDTSDKKELQMRVKEISGCEIEEHSRTGTHNDSF